MLSISFSQPVSGICSYYLPAAAHDFVLFFFFNDTATTEIYTLSLHDALPILLLHTLAHVLIRQLALDCGYSSSALRSEEHTSELQSHLNLVCRLLLEKKKLP